MVVNIEMDKYCRHIGVYYTRIHPNEQYKYKRDQVGISDSKVTKLILKTRKSFEVRSL